MEFINRAPLLPVLLSLVIGVVTATLNGWICGCIIAAILLAGLVLFVRKEIFLFVCLMGGSLAGGVVMMTDDFLHRCNVPLGEKSEVVGTIERIRESEHSFRLLLALSDKYRGTCYVTVTNPHYNLAVGDIIRLNTTFAPPVIRKDVSDQETLDRFYFLHHVGCTALVNGSYIEVLGKNTSLKFRLIRLRERMVDMLARSSLSPRAQGFIAILLVGDDSMLVEGNREKYSSAGVAHVLALSGMHIAVLVMIAAWILFPLSFMGHHRLKWIMIITALWLYAVMTGLSPSVVRAVLMLTLIIVARYSGHRHSSLNALCLAAILIVIVTPRALFIAGFQLTFVATASLICVPVILGIDFKKQRKGIPGRVLRWLWYFVIFTVSATAGTLLLSVYWFHKVPLYFLFTNIPCAILLPPVLVLGLIIIVFQALGFEWSFLTFIENRLCDVIDYTVEINSNLPGHVIDDVYISQAAVVFGYIALLMAMWGIYYRKKLIAAGAIACVLSVLVYPFTRDSNDRLFIARSSSASTIVYTQGHDAYYFTTALSSEKPGIEERLKSYYKKFLGIRGIKNLHLLNPGEAKNGLISLGQYSILVINDNEFSPVEIVPDYTVVGGGFKGDVLELAAIVPSDTILLGTDINGIRRKRYFRELTGAGYAVRDLRDTFGLELALR